VKFEITILGCGAATPTLKRNPSSQLVNLHDKHLLIDCAEGTQLQLRKCKIKFQRINHIMISHLHGDHYLGLPGLLSSMHLLGRTAPVSIYAPADLKELIHVNLKFSETFLNFKWIFHPLDFESPEVILEDDKFTITSFPMNHRIKCCGFRIDEKPKRRRIIKHLAEESELTIAEIVQLKNGKSVVRESGEELESEKFTLDPHPHRSYAYCSDTAPFEGQIELIKEVDVLYHESTFTDQHVDRAADTYHSTARQAGEIAKKGNVKKLVLGHFSSRYKEVDEFAIQAKEEFPHVILAKDGMRLVIE
jgi:ribonuclease Z